MYTVYNKSYDYIDCDSLSQHDKMIMFIICLISWPYNATNEAGTSESGDRVVLQCNVSPVSVS